MIRERRLRWEEREPDLFGVVDEVGRLFRRAKHRKLLVLTITVLMTALLSVREFRKQRSYPATVVLSATESEDAQVGNAHTNARLSDYVWYAVFTDRTLFALMEKHRYRPDMMKKNPRLALESFREDLDVDVYKNEFNRERYGGEAPRSARIAVSFSASTPEMALAMARDLGELVVQRDAEIRRERFEMEKRVRTDAVSYAEAELSRLHREMEAVDDEYPTASPRRRGELRVEAAGLDGAIVASEARLREAQNAKRRLDLESSADKVSLALQYERVDWGAAKQPVNLTFVLVRAIILAFFGLLPVVAMGVGAFDPRIYAEEDVARMRLKPLGLVKTFAMRNARS
jgi:hypothetical protein